MAGSFGYETCRRGGGRCQSRPASSRCLDGFRSKSNLGASQGAGDAGEPELRTAVRHLGRILHLHLPLRAEVWNRDGRPRRDDDNVHMNEQDEATTIPSTSLQSSYRLDSAWGGPFER